MEDRSKNLLPLLAGLAAGIAIGYYIASGDNGKFVEDIIRTGTKIKSDLEKMQQAGKQFVEDLGNKMNDLQEPE